MMKTIFFLFGFIFCSLNLLGQTDSVPTEYKRGVNNTYIIDYFLKYKSISIANDIYPFKGKENEVTWSDWYRVDAKAIGALSQYIEPYIGPYLKNVTLTKEDVFMVTIWFDLQGNPAYFIFDYPSKLNIPITVIEQIETSLKANGKVKVTPTQYAHTQKIYYLQLGLPLSLKRLQDQLNKPVEPTWNSDIVVRLGQFYPTSNSFANRYDARSPQYLYSDMFNFTDDSNTTEANIYISGTGEAVISLDLINQTGRDIILDLAKIRVKVSESGVDYFPTITSMSVDAGPLLRTPSKIVIPANAGSQLVAFHFDKIIEMPESWYGTYRSDYTMKFYYEDKNLLNWIIDERYDYLWEDKVDAVWYKNGYIMLRYMYNKNKVGMYYNKATDTYFY